MQPYNKAKAFLSAILAASGILAASPVAAGMPATIPVFPDPIRVTAPPPKACENLLPLSQPRYWGNSSTVEPTYWVFSVNFQEIGLYAQGPGVGGCLKMIGRDPAVVNSAYVVLREEYVDCIFSTQYVNGVPGWGGGDFGGRGTVTYGAPTLDAARFGGTGTGLWQPVTFRGGAYLRCPNVDLKGRIDYQILPLPNSNLYASVEQVSKLKHFSMAAFGSSVAGVVNSASTNPLITYVPDATACKAYQAGSCGATALSAPFVQGSLWQIRTRLNGASALATAQNANALDMQYVHTEYTSVNPPGVSTVYQRRFQPLGNVLTPTYQAPTTVTTQDAGYFRFWTGKSTIYVGKDPAKSNDFFEGTLYEAIVDPSGDSKPPQ